MKKFHNHNTLCLFFDVMDVQSFSKAAYFCWNKEKFLDFAGFKTSLAWWIFIKRNIYLALCKFDRFKTTDF